MIDSNDFATIDEVTDNPYKALQFISDIGVDCDGYGDDIEGLRRLVLEFRLCAQEALEKARKRGEIE